EDPADRRAQDKVLQHPVDAPAAVRSLLDGDLAAGLDRDQIVVHAERPSGLGGISRPAPGRLTTGAASSRPSAAAAFTELAYASTYVCPVSSITAFMISS